MVAVVLQVNAEELRNQISDTQPSIDNLASKLLDRTLNAWHLHHEGLENTLIAKPNRGALPNVRGTVSSKTSPVRSSSVLHQLQEDTLIQRRTLEQWWEAVEPEVWEMVQGRKERRWSPDRRPESQQGKQDGPGKDSQLSWDGLKSALQLEKMAQRQHAAYLERLNTQMQNLPLGSAATVLYGESAKADARLDAEISAGLDKMIRIAKVPEGAEGKIDGPVAFAELIMGKYGKYHDVAVMRNAGQVAFNIYEAYLGQASFRYTEGQYLQKLESILSLLNDLEETWYIKEFLTSPVQPRNGLPATPRADTAVTVRLNESPTWDDTNDPDIVEAWYMLKGRR